MVNLDCYLPQSPPRTPFVITGCLCYGALENNPQNALGQSKVSLTNKYPYIQSFIVHTKKESKHWSISSTSLIARYLITKLYSIYFGHFLRKVSSLFTKLVIYEAEKLTTLLSIHQNTALRVSKKKFKSLIERLTQTNTQNNQVSYIFLVKDLDIE